MIRERWSSLKRGLQSMEWPEYRRAIHDMKKDQVVLSAAVCSIAFGIVAGLGSGLVDVARINITHPAVREMRSLVAEDPFVQDYLRLGEEQAEYFAQNPSELEIYVTASEQPSVAQYKQAKQEWVEAPQASTYLGVGAVGAAIPWGLLLLGLGVSARKDIRSFREQEAVPTQ